MVDLIDRNALPYENQVLSIDEDWCLKVSDIESAPAVDAVTVVRCKDCIGKSTWYNVAEYGFAICGMSGMYPKSEDDYCSYGEMKTE